MTAKETPPDGWYQRHNKVTFSNFAGPFYVKEGPQVGVGFYPKAHHLNHQGLIHGGALLTLCDMALWEILCNDIGEFKGVTVTLNTEFIAAARGGHFVEATGEALKTKGSLLFARGTVTSNGETLMVFSGTLKNLRKRQEK